MNILATWYIFIVILIKKYIGAIQITNCTQQKLSCPGSRKGVSVQNQFAVFAMQTHSSAPNAGVVDIFNASSKKWFVTQYSAGRTNIAGTSWRHLAIFAGGTAERGQPKSDSVDVWNSLTNKWSLEHMSIGRDLLAIASAGNCTIFAGGSAPQVNQSETDVVDIWNHATGEWKTAKLSQKRKKPEAVAAGNVILIGGGEIAKPGLNGYSNVVDIFDTVTSVWSTTNLSQARQYFGAARATPELAVFGGGFYNSQRLSVVDIYNATDGTWINGQPLSHNRSNLEAANVGDRYVAFGSGNIDADAKVTYDFFDGKTGEWIASHGHCPGNPAVTGVKNIAMFAHGDGVVDSMAINGDCSSLPHA